MAFSKKAVKPYASKEIYVVLDNLSMHTTPEVKARTSKNPHIHFPFTPVGSSWLNQIEIWFGTLTRQSIRRGRFCQIQRPGRPAATAPAPGIRRQNPSPGPRPLTRFSPRSGSSRLT